MELFKVVNRENKAFNNDSFVNKMDAKALRDELNADTKDKVWRVTRGKDNLPSPKARKSRNFSQRK